MSWKTKLNGDPLPWLLEPDNPPVRYSTLRDLLDRPPDDPERVEAKGAIISYAPIQASLDAQHPQGYWAKPGAGYGPKYRSTVWQIIFLQQMEADGRNLIIRRGCEYLLTHTQTKNGGFGCSAAKSWPPPPSRVLHCLNGNLLRALLGLGYTEDERVMRAVEWQAQAITGEGNLRYYKSGTSGPSFACGVNDGLPCAWGAIKALRGLAYVPADRRSPLVVRAIRDGVEFLLSRDPAQADYPAANDRVSSSWFKLGFPSGYVADVLQNLEVLVELGCAGDERLGPAVEWVLSQQDKHGRWKNRYAYNGKLWLDVEKQGAPSKWVTLRALRLLKTIDGKK